MGWKILKNCVSSAKIIPVFCWLFQSVFDSELFLTSWKLIFFPQLTPQKSPVHKFGVIKPRDYKILTNYAPLSILGSLLLIEIMYIYLKGTFDSY